VTLAGWRSKFSLTKSRSIELSPIGANAELRTDSPSRPFASAPAVAVALIAVFFFGSTANAAIHYEVSVAHPEQHVFHVAMTIPDVSGEVTVQMPAWNALYQIRDFASRVMQVEAFSGAQALPIEKLDKQTWRIRGDGTITVRYGVYWNDGGPFATELNNESAFINPAMILFYVPARRSEEVSLAMADMPDEWDVAGAALRMSEQMGRAKRFTVPSGVGAR